MDSDDIQATKLHTVLRHTKALALQQGKVDTDFIGKWKHGTSAMTVRVYKKYYRELGMTEYWLKFKGVVVVVCSEEYLFSNYTRVDPIVIGGLYGEK